MQINTNYNNISMDFAYPYVWKETNEFFLIDKSKNYKYNVIQ